MVGDYKVGEIMEENVIASYPEESILNCARKMAYKKVGSLVIMEDTKVVGVITEQDIARKVVAKEISPKSTPVKEVMSKEVHFISPEKDIQEAIELMGKNEIKHLPVIDYGNIVGIITAKDIIAIEPVLIDVLKFKSSSRKNIGMYS